MVVISDKPGHLANRLIISSHFVASAMEHGYRVANPAFDELAPHFVQLEKDVLCRYPTRRSVLARLKLLRRLIYWVIRGCASLLGRLPLRLPGVTLIRLADNERMSLDSSFAGIVSRWRLVFVQGWLFRDDRSLSRHAAAVRKIFEPREDIRSYVARVMESVRQGADVVVGVHIRQGDYATHLKGEFYFPTIKYVEVMHRIERLLAEKRIKFFLTSNVSQDESQFDGLDCYFAKGDRFQDLFSLAACDYIVGPPSSFSLWASFYGTAPLYPITDPDSEFGLDDFAITPDIRNARVRALY